MASSQKLRSEASHARHLARLAAGPTLADWLEDIAQQMDREADHLSSGSEGEPASMISSRPGARIAGI